MDRFLTSLPTRKKAIQNAAGSIGKKRKSECLSDGEQMFLDFGQKTFGNNSACPKCGMVFVGGHPDDESRHAVFCKKVRWHLHFSSCMFSLVYISAGQWLRKDIKYEQL